MGRNLKSKDGGGLTTIEKKQIIPYLQESYFISQECLEDILSEAGSGS